jgi:protein-disulfide isomerase-like protein with CxxC motif
VGVIDTILSWVRLRRESKARTHELVSDVQTAALSLIDAIYRQRYVDGARFHDIEETKARLAAALNRLPQRWRSELPACERLTRETWESNFRFPTWNVEEQRSAVLDEAGKALAALS